MAGSGRFNALGRFIALEGVDGSGKSGALRALSAALAERGFEVVATREPGGTPAGLALRRLLLSESGFAWDPKAELLLMVAARVQHVADLIAPALARGAIVLTDRYVGSTLAYQGAGRGLDLSLIRDLHRTCVGDRWPDLTLLFDVDPRIGVERSRRRLSGEQADEGRFEGLDLDFHDRVRASFLAQAADDPTRFAVIDAARPVASVTAEALTQTLRLLDQPVP